MIVVHICNSYVVDLIYVLLDDLRDLNLYCVLDILIDPYCSPFFITCSDQTFMQEHVRGMVCIRWSNMVVVRDCDSKFQDLL